MAAFVTCYARLKLFKEIDKLGDRVLYYDTDSVIFVSDPRFENSDKFPTLGNYLGDFTNEVENPSTTYITEFVSTGPKSYAYRLTSNETKCIIKGFELTYEASLQVNIDVMKELVHEHADRQIIINQSRITRNKYAWELCSSELEKVFMMIYDKRVVDLNDPNFRTFPYGYLE